MSPPLDLGLDTFGGVTAGQPGDFLREADHGSLYVGSPETVARKIAGTARALGLSRFDMKYRPGPLSHEKLARSLGLYGRVVIPMVRDILSSRYSAA